MWFPKSELRPRPRWTLGPPCNNNRSRIMQFSFVDQILWAPQCGRRPRARGRALTPALFVSALCTTAFATDYYVSPGGSDSNPGSLTQPFRTVARGVAAASSGDRVILQDGTYGNEGYISDGTGCIHGCAAPVSINKAGTPNAYITVTAANPGRAILDCGTTADSLGCDLYIYLKPFARYWT